MKRAGPLLVLAGVVLLTGSEALSQFRQFEPIATPEPTPQGFVPTEELITLPRPLIEQELRQFFANWNQEDLRDHLSEQFFDRSRLSDEINAIVPPDAQLRLLALQAVDVTDQFEKLDQDGHRILITRITAVAQTQTEFTNTNGTFQRLEGTHQYRFTITAKITRATK